MNILKSFLNFSLDLQKVFMHELRQKQRRLLARKLNLEETLMDAYGNLTLIDIGASYFIPKRWTYAAKSKKSRLIAIDPNEQNLKHLQGSITCSLEIIPLAVGKEIYERNFYILDPDSGSSLFKPKLRPEHIIRLSSEKIRSFHPTRVIKVSTHPFTKVVVDVDTESPIWMKLDVQGAELEILKDLENFSAKERIVLIELEASTLRNPIMDGSAKLSEILEYLEKMGFELTWIEPIYESGHLNAKSDLKFEGYLAECNLLFVKNLGEFEQWALSLKMSLFLGLISYGLISEAYQIAVNDSELTKKLEANGLFSKDNRRIMKLLDSLVV